MTKPPTWFDLANYAETAGFGAREWLEVLERTARLDALSDHAPSEVFQHWRDGHPHGSVIEIADEERGTPGGLPPVTEFPEELLGQPIKPLVPPFRLLLVDTSASRESILRAMDKWLRGTQKLPVMAGRGVKPKKPRLALPEDVFRAWANNQILALWDLDFCRRHDVQFVASDRDFGEWLFPDRSGDPCDLVFRARETYRKAVQMIDALRGEVLADLAD